MVASTIAAMTISPLTSIQVIADDVRLASRGWLPARAYDSAALDLRAMFDEDDPNTTMGGTHLVIPPRSVMLIPSGLRLWIGDPNYVGLMFPRSGTGHKRGLILGLGTGVIDADYQGPLAISAYNRTDEPITIELGERIAQLAIVPIARPSIDLVEEFNGTTSRGVGGFGSTGSA